jgi:hypothetical protein
MKWVIVKREKKPAGKTFRYRELKLNPDGTFDDYGKGQVIFPTKEQAQFVANGFPLGINIEYIVKPYEHPEIT